MSGLVLKRYRKIKDGRFRLGTLQWNYIWTNFVLETMSWYRTKIMKCQKCNVALVPSEYV